MQRGHEKMDVNNGVNCLYTHGQRGPDMERVFTRCGMGICMGRGSLFMAGSQSGKDG